MMQKTLSPARPSPLALLETVGKAIADRTRIRILCLLAEGELCVCQIAAALELAMPTASRHLSSLKSAGLVLSRRDGKWVHYRLSHPAQGSCAATWLVLMADGLEEDPQVVADRHQLSLVLSRPLESLCGGSEEASLQCSS